MIYDLGGGTFDVSVLTIEDGIFEVRLREYDCQVPKRELDSKGRTSELVVLESRHRIWTLLGLLYRLCSALARKIFDFRL